MTRTAYCCFSDFTELLNDKEDLFCVELFDSPNLAAIKFLRSETRRLGMSISNTNKPPTKANLRQVAQEAHGLLSRRAFTMVEVKIDRFQDLLNKGEATLSVGGGGFVMRDWEPGNFPCVLTDSYVSVEVANATVTSSKAESTLAEGPAPYMHVFYFINGSIGDMIGNMCWRNTVQPRKGCDMAPCFTDHNVLGMLAWISQSGACARFTIYKIMVNDETLQKEFRHIHDCKLTDFWLSNHVKQDVGQTEMLINVKIVEGRKASYRDLISLELQKVKENNVEELQHTRALLLEQVKMVEAQLEKYQTADREADKAPEEPASQSAQQDPKRRKM